MIYLLFALDETNKTLIDLFWDQEDAFNAKDDLMRYQEDKGWSVECHTIQGQNPRDADAIEWHNAYVDALATITKLNSRNREAKEQLQKVINLL